MIAAFYNWLDRRRDLQKQLDWRSGFLTAIGEREFEHLPKPATELQIATASDEFRAGYAYGMGCSLAIGSPQNVNQLN